MAGRGVEGGEVSDPIIEQRHDYTPAGRPRMSMGALAAFIALGLTMIGGIVSGTLYLAGIDSRVAVVNSDVQHINTDISEIKDALKTLFQRNFGKPQ